MSHSTHYRSFADHFMGFPHKARHWLKFCKIYIPYLEQSSAARHVSTITGHLSQSLQDSSLQALISITSTFSCRAREMTCHYGHVNRFCYLLLLLTYPSSKEQQPVTAEDLWSLQFGTHYKATRIEN